MDEKKKWKRKIALLPCMLCIVSKLLKAICVAMLVLVISVGMFTENVMAAYKYYNSYSFTTGWWFWETDCKVKVYKDTNSYYNIYYGNTKVSTGFDYKPNYKEPIIIAQTNNMSFSEQTVESMNAELDLSDYEIPLKIGGSCGSTSEQSWGVANAITRTVSASDPIGYYSYNVLMNTTRLRLDLYEDGSYESRVYISAPMSEPYRAIVYSKDGNYYNATKYY